MVKATNGDRLGTSRPELATLLAVMHDAVAIVSPHGVITSWNAAATELYGSGPEEMLGRHMDGLVAPHRRADDAAMFHRVVEGEVTEEYGTEWVTKDGGSVPISLTMSAIADGVGGVLGAVLLSRRRAEPGRQPSEPAIDGRDTARLGQAQQSQRMEVLGQLAGGVAHDFNNLLAVILNYAAFVSEELVADAHSAPDWEQRRELAQRDVGQIQRAAERATELTRQLLAFARREVVQPRVLDLNDAVSAVEDLLRRTLDKDIDLVISLPTSVWPILADPGQIEQVLLNLAINASDAMPAGGTLRIDSADVVVDADSVAGGSSVRPGRYVRLRVSDTGSGMTADVVDHAFEPFFTTKGDGVGTGLGLATVYGIVTQTEATIGIQSETGVGTTFTIMLPVTDEAAAVIVDPQMYERTPKGETVLVVEDEEALREVTERIFTRNGYHVMTAANGADAIALVAAYVGDIHLLVTDVVMPKMLGKEVADHVRALRPRIDVLYMSGYAQPVLASRGRLEPGVALVDKPFSEAALLAKAAQVLNGHFRGFETVPTDTDGAQGTSL